MAYPILIQDLIQPSSSLSVLNDTSVKEVLKSAGGSIKYMLNVLAGIVYFGKRTKTYDPQEVRRMMEYLKQLGIKESTIEKYAKYLEKHGGSKCKSDDVDCIIEELKAAGIISDKEQTASSAKKILSKFESKIKRLADNKGKVAATLLVVSIVALVGLAYKFNLIPGDKPWSFDFFKHLADKIKNLPRPKQVLIGVIAGIGLASFAYLGYKAAKIAIRKIIDLVKGILPKS